ncbi:MAG: MATE family efflux transporter [Acidimicrobiia bacterium]
MARQDGLSEPSTRRILGLVIPALGALASDPLVSLVDTAFVGRLGPTALAALGVDVAIFGFAFALFNFLAYATTPLVAAARGRGDLRSSGDVVRQALALGLVIGVGAGVFLAVAAPLLVALFDPGPGVADPAVSYLRIRATALPALLVIMAGHGAFRGFQDTRTPLALTLVVNACNVILNPVLMFWAGFGLDGAAMATVIAQWAGAVGFLLLIRKRATEEGWNAGTVRLTGSGPLLRVGGVLMIRTLLLVASLAVATATATRVGTRAVAAHQIVSQLWFFLALVVDALAIAAQAMIAELSGAGRMDTARALSGRLHRWGLSAGVILGALLWASSGPLVGVFTDDPGVRGEATAALVIAAVMQPLAALVFVSDGVYMALMRMRRLAASTAAGFVAMLVGSALTLSGGWGLSGVWWAMVAMVAARGLVLAVGYRGVFQGAGSAHP